MIILRFSNAAHCQKVILGAAGSRYITLQCGHVLLSRCCVSNVLPIYRNLLIPIHNSQKYGGKTERVKTGYKIVKARLAGL